MATNFSHLTRYEYFCELFYNLTYEERVTLVNMYFIEFDFDNYIHEFTEDFFNTYLSSPLEAAQKVFFGNVQNWCDPYIHFNGYGNLESLTDYQAAEIAECYIGEIYENIDFSDYIDLSEYDEFTEE
jgi:hypothetical protein